MELQREWKHSSLYREGEGGGGGRSGYVGGGAGWDNLAPDCPIRKWRPDEGSVAQSSFGEWRLISNALAYRPNSGSRFLPLAGEIARAKKKNRKSSKSLI